MSATGSPLARTAGTFGVFPYACMIPTLQNSELRKHLLVRLNDLWQTKRVEYRFQCPKAPAFMPG